MKLIPNDQQLEAIRLGTDWYRSKSKQVFEIAGYAGTGKTTLVNWILKACGIKKEEGAYVAFVGKAAMVLAQKGLPAKTIHSTIYEPIDTPKRDADGKPIYEDGKLLMTRTFRLKKALDPRLKIIILDEGSMVDSKLFADLKSFGLPIIVLGDLHQLPPVFGKSGCLEHPDVTLTEIMRQAEDNPIIHFATMARTKRFSAFKYGSYGKVYIGPKEELLRNHRLIKSSNAIICAYNRTRAELNEYIRREVYGFPETKLCIGDKLICRENNWNRSLDENTYLINGMVGFVEDIHLECFTGSSVMINFRPEFLPNKMFYDLPIDYDYLDMDYLQKKSYRSMFNKLEYGYAITCHLSQGSQYKNVLVVNEDLHRGYEAYSRWLYTAITRAIDNLVIAM